MEKLTNRLQLRDFRLLLAIQQTGQLALAAEQLAMTQPAASRMLASIEKIVGTKVFERHPKGMTPTPVGEILARNAVNLLRGLDMAEREVQSFSVGLAGSAHVGAVTGGAVGFVVPAIQELKKIAKGSDIHVHVGPSDILVEGLINGEFDFVLSRIPSGTDARQFSVQRGRVEVVHFLVRPGHPLASREKIELRDLQGYELVIQAPRSPMRNAVEEAFTAAGIPLPPEIVNTTSLLVMIAYLGSTDAIAPISREVAGLLGSGMSPGGYITLDLKEPIIINPYHLLSYKYRMMSPLAERLRALVADRINNP